MKKAIWLMLLVIGIFVLGGCKGSAEEPAKKQEPKGPSKQDVMQYVSDSENKVTYIKQAARATVTVTNSNNSDYVTESTVDGEMTYKDGALKELLSVVKQNNRQVETYATGEKVYVKVGGKWQDVSNSSTLRTETSYIPAVTMFKSTADEFKMKKQGDDYVFTFKGSGETMFEKIRAFYNLRLSNIPVSESNLELTYTVDAKQKYLKQVTQVVTAERNSQKLKMEIKADFTDYNKKTSLPAPGDINL